MSIGGHCPGARDSPGTSAESVRRSGPPAEVRSGVEKRGDLENADVEIMFTIKHDVESPEPHRLYKKNIVLERSIKSAQT